MKKTIKLRDITIASFVLLAASVCQSCSDNSPQVTTLQYEPVPVTTLLEVQAVPQTTLEVVTPVQNTTLEAGNQAASATQLQAGNQPNTQTELKTELTQTSQVETQPVPPTTATVQTELKTESAPPSAVESEPPPTTPAPAPAAVEPPPTQPSQVETQPVPPTTATVEKNLTELQAEVTREGIKFNLPDNILFEFDKYNVRAQAKPTLAKVNQLLSHYKDAQVFIFGHTDSKGDDTYNLGLSHKRSAAVKYYFVNVFKVPATRMQTKGLGETKPIAPNENPDGSDNEAGRAKNRRVEFFIKTPTRKEVRSPGADPFRDAVKYAQDAAVLVQSAKTQEDWQKVVEKWEEAIAQMKAVPESSPNYQNAQKKAAEYEKNLNYAEQNAQ